jgi:selenocysteine lyase/cysteine desulfurase
VQKDLLRLVMNHFRLGYTWALLIPNLFLALLVLADLAGYWIHTRSLPRVLYALSCLSCASGGLAQPGGISPVAALRSLLIFAFFLLVILPLLLGVVRVVSRRPPRRMDVARRPVRVLLYHLAFCAVFIYFFFVAAAMRNLSGLELKDGVYYYGSSPLVFLVITLDVFRWFLLSLVSLVSSAVSLVVFGILVGRETPAVLKQYMVRADLADLPSELRPLPGKAQAYPRIAFVQERSGELERQYRSLATEPKKAIEWLDLKWESCQQLIRKNLFEKPAGDRILPEVCELFTAPGGAFDAALAGVPRPRLIVISPYASPHLRELLEWRAAEAGDSVTSLAFAPDDYLLDWAAQEAKIIQAAEAAVRSQGGNALIVLSEVSYASGRRSILPELITHLKDALAGREFQVAVDGTNAVGNRGRILTDAGWDYYVFAPHRWLLAPEPCEILLSKKPRNERPAAPGLWRQGTPKSEGEITVVTGLHSALELLDRYGLKYFWERGERLCQESRLGMPGNVQIVGENSGTLETFIVSCCPRAGNFWRLELDELEKLVVEKHLRASVLRLDPKRPWVRVTIPYYSDFQDLRRVCEFLGEMAR